MLYAKFSDRSCPVLGCEHETLAVRLPSWRVLTGPHLKQWQGAGRRTSTRLRVLAPTSQTRLLAPVASVAAAATTRVASVSRLDGGPELFEPQISQWHLRYK